MLFARLCNTVGLAEPKRRHSWGSEIEFRLPELQHIDDDDDDDDDDDEIRTYSEDEDINSDKEEYLIGLDLIASCHDIITPLTSSSSSSDEEEEEEEEEENTQPFEENTVTQSHSRTTEISFSSTKMGQGSSSATLHRPKLSLTWVLRNGSERKQIVASPEPPIKFQYSKVRRKSSESIKRANNTDFISGKSDTLFQKIVMHEDSLKKCGFTSLADIRTIKSVEHLSENVNRVQEKSLFAESLNRKKMRRKNHYKTECDTGTCLQTVVNCGETNSICDGLTTDNLSKLSRIHPNRYPDSSMRVKKSDLKHIKNKCVPKIYQQSIELKKNDYYQEHISSKTDLINSESNKMCSASVNVTTNEQISVSHNSNYYHNSINHKQHSVKSIQINFDDEDCENNSKQNNAQDESHTAGVKHIINNYEQLCSNSKSSEDFSKKSLHVEKSTFISKSVGDLRKISGEISNAKHAKTKDFFYKTHSKKSNQNHIKSLTKDVNIRNLKTDEQQNKIENPYTLTDSMRYQNKINAVNETYNKTNYNESKSSQKEGFLSSRKRTTSEPTLNAISQRNKEKHRQKRRSRSKIERKLSQFGYDIEDVDAFLTKASLDKPANIPVVLSFPTVLYQTYYNGCQDEIPLPLGMVVNAIFKKESWLYVQTPHAEEGYVNYTACLPLGIIPQVETSNKISPCWETSTDVFPRPCGNMTDSEKLTRSECGGLRCKKKNRQPSVSSCGEQSVDRLYLRAAANAKTTRKEKRQTLLVVDSNYSGRRKNTISVAAGDVVALISAHLKDWFWVRARDGSEGFIPAKITGHGYF